MIAFFNLISILLLLLKKYIKAKIFYLIKNKI